MASLAVLQHPTVESGSDSVKVSSVVPEAVSFLDTTLDFKDVKNLESITISVNGLIINSEFSKNTQRKYYELCRSQGASLHKNLPEGIDMKFAVGAIAETVTVADAIKSCNLSNSRDDFSAWDKSLGVLEQLGMNVGFLRAQVEQLLRVVIESEEAANCYNEALY
ncbi:hypothetical protein IFM89_012375 [Coptis chinensis]|uniref:Uncharacterized protein n=1 Tax=Coptis chinensis TaxID=261450 RepID=A0A835HLY6_9MAGN|nr:hypothetical protein IFM89_012375 [Coptis chinensis]